MRIILIIAASRLFESLMTHAAIAPDAVFFRIEKVLAFIHQNIDQPLSIEQIAEKSCWSRWQLQRVFQAHLKKSVASYVRELKLSRAAEAMLDGRERVIDIATRLGFSSEISFSRSFKQHFQQSPRAYRNAGIRRGLVQPTAASEIVTPRFDGRRRFVEVRVESDIPLSLTGIKTNINGMFAHQPNFTTRVPALWKTLHDRLPGEHKRFTRFTGVIDLTNSHNGTDGLIYWATVDRHELNGQLTSDFAHKLTPIEVPKQTYAVIKHQGPVGELPSTLLWFLLRWLPDSGYQGIEGLELEHYPPDYDMHAEQAEMEFWLPIKPD